MQKERFCEYIREYENAMYAVAFSVVQNESDAAEVLSESVYRAYKNLPSLRNPKAFKSWLLRIVHNTAVEEIRKHGKCIPTDSFPEAEAEERVEITTKLALREAVESLPQPYRTVVVLFYYENLPTSDIANITQTAEPNVRKQLSRARGMLKELLKEDFLE